jgi:hypothetical protein
MDRIVIGNHAAEVSVSRAYALAGLGALAVGSLFGMLGKIVGWFPAVAALGGAMLGGVGIFTAVAWRKAMAPTEEDDLYLPNAQTGALELTFIATYLRRYLGADVTAYLSGSENVADVSRWVSGEAEPAPLPAGRLRYGYETIRPIVDRYDGDTAKAWLFGTNPWLRDEAPVYVLRHSDCPEVWQKVVGAAQDFAEFKR